MIDIFLVGILIQLCTPIMFDLVLAEIPRYIWKPSSLMIRSSVI